MVHISSVGRKCSISMSGVPSILRSRYQPRTYLLPCNLQINKNTIIIFSNSAWNCSIGSSGWISPVSFSSPGRPFFPRVSPSPAACTVAPISPRVQTSSSYVAWFSIIPACKKSIASSPTTVRPPLGYRLPVCKTLSGLKRCNVTVHTSALWV